MSSEGQKGGAEALDVSERGAARDGVAQSLDRRLFMQLLCYGCGPGEGVEATAGRLRESLATAGISSVFYADVTDPRGFGVLAWSEAPSDFVLKLRPALAAHATLVPKPDLTMFGRSYSTGYENDLAFWLLERPAATVLNEGWPWAVWYPLRRTGAFARLDPKEQGAILREHGAIGRAYGEADLAHDVRLACHGLDARDNEFVIGLVGKDLHPLSHVVQSMRRTRQTSEYMAQMGPFFVGYALWRHKA
ncbi:MAG: chlorite dismutase family protein [Myxococcales bacterium]|nr:chlorite dismutase family protein [Myxococcales bacterium]